jgi:LAO/AO transport system ATPase
MPSELLEGLRRHDRRSLARLITLAARGQHIDAIRNHLGPPHSRAHVIAITGSAGVGKSTLVGKLIEQLRKGGKSVAVLACDPQSPLTGGALLGDRFRMSGAADDADVYIRSLAAASGRQAVADHLDTVILLCEHFGFDFVLIETVGAGQGDTAFHSLADAVVLLLQPETGDDLQWEKAGVLEVANVIVIHKADLPGADRAAAQVKAALELAGGREVPVLLASSRTGAGLPELAATLEGLPKRPRDGGAAGELLFLAQQELAARFHSPEMDSLAADWQAGKVTTAEALKRVFQTR